MGIRKIIKSCGITYKIIIFTYAVILILTSILGYLFYSTSEKYVLKEVSNTHLNMVRQIDRGIDTLQRDMYDLSTFIATSHMVQSYLNNYVEGITPLYNTKRDLDDLMLNLVVSKEFISLLMLYSNNYEYSPYYVCTDLSSGIQPYSTVKASNTYPYIFTNEGAPHWFTLQTGSTFLMEQNNNHKVVLGRSIKNMNNYMQMGTLFLGFNTQTISDLYEDIIDPTKEGIVITDHEGHLITTYGIDFYNSSLVHEIINTAGHIHDFDSDLLLSYSQENRYNWRIFYAMDKRNTSMVLKEKKKYVLFIVLLCLMTSLPVLFILTTYITSPIKKLLASMKRFKKGNFDEQVSITYEDEIGQLSHVYNDMVKEIKLLIDQNYVLAIKEREAELIALQAQINPHFLYNTLDTIYWKAQGSKDTDIADMIYALSRLFRLSLNKGSDYILISNEIELLKHYLTLQKMRFGKKLGYEIQIPPSLANYPIPRFTIQPFVENAIIHGLEPLATPGMIIIQGSLEGSYIKISIEDNGVGMSIDEALNNKESSYAIKNIKERLFLYYQEDNLLHISSTLGKGTTITIYIPVTS